ncbi:hypothetical protein [Myroides odoratus]|uniref:hypothetical protein n=1 Tax=Myroides odoratus TaxID=256 RepID=UPI00333F6CCF
MRYITIVCILLFGIKITCNAQTGRPEYCECEIVGNPSNIIDNDDSIPVVKADYKNDKLHIKVFNNSKDTIYFFKSYFEKDISLSNYIYRYDKKSKKVKVSFLPLIPYLYTKYSDRIVFNDRIIGEYQTVYDFYVIPPFYEYAFDVDVLDIGQKQNYIKDVNAAELNKFQKIKKIKNINLKDKKNVDFSIEIAYYKDVSIICNRDSYFLNELKFNKQAKEFYKVEIPLVEVF